MPSSHGRYHQRRHREARSWREIRNALAAHGLVPGPRRLAAAPPLGFDDDAFAARLRGALEGLGETFALLGRYLATRLDLVSIGDSLELARIADRARPLPAEDVEAALRVELGETAQDLRPLDPAPCATTLTRQVHRTERSTGERLLVRIVRADLYAGAEAELEAARQPLERIFAAYGRALASPSWLDDFRHELARWLDARLEAEALELLAPAGDEPDDHEPPPFAVTRVAAVAASGRLLVTEDPGGRAIGELAARRSPARRQDLARRLAQVWLHQALAGRAFPIEADVHELPDGRLAIAGGLFSSLPAAARTHLRDYLRFTARHQPDLASAELRRELRPGPRAASDGELRSRLRQVIPFRDGGWSADGDDVAEYAVLHWRVARQLGFEAPPHLESFYRGLYRISRWPSRSSGSRRSQGDAGDPLRAALEDFERTAAWNRLRQLTTPESMAATLESYLESALVLAPKLERALEQMSRGDAGDPRPDRRAKPSRRRRHMDSGAAVMALLMGLAALALMARPLVEHAVLGAWTEAAVALPFAVFAFVLLRVLSK